MKLKGPDFSRAELAQLSRASYHTYPLEGQVPIKSTEDRQIKKQHIIDKTGTLPPGFKAVKQYNHPINGMRATLFRKGFTPKYALVYRGTSISEGIRGGWQDLWADAKLYLGLRPWQVSSALDANRDAHALIGPKGKLTLSGHSLGAYLASIVGRQDSQDSRTVAFNGPGLLFRQWAKKTDQNGKPVDESNIVHYVVADDIVANLHRRPGTVKVLAPRNTNFVAAHLDWERLAKGCVVSEGDDGHRFWQAVGSNLAKLPATLMPSLRKAPQPENPLCDSVPLRNDLSRIKRSTKRVLKRRNKLGRTNARQPLLKTP